MHTTYIDDTPLCSSASHRSTIEVSDIHGSGLGLCLRGGSYTLHYKFNDLPNSNLELPLRLQLHSQATMHLRSLKLHVPRHFRFGKAKKVEASTHIPLTAIASPDVPPCPPTSPCLGPLSPPRTAPVCPPTPTPVPLPPRKPTPDLPEGIHIEIGEMMISYSGLGLMVQAPSHWEEYKRLCEPPPEPEHLERWY